MPRQSQRCITHCCARYLTALESRLFRCPFQVIAALLDESRRRAYLDAMQVDTWLPRTALPFAAASRPESLAELTVIIEADAVVRTPKNPSVAAPSARTEPVSEPRKPVVAPVKPVIKAAIAEPAADVESVILPAKVNVPIPRFALQLLRAGNCLLLVELPTGEALQSRDPAYVLLKDLLRAAGLPDAPQLLGEPIRWPLLARGSFDQGPEAARDFVQGCVAVQLEQGTCACLWLIGLPAVRFAGDGQAADYDLPLSVEGLGAAWALPGLELLMDEPQRKASLWQAMQRLAPRWHNLTSATAE